MNRALLPLLLTLAPSGCKKADVRLYDNSLFEVASGFSAKEVCSCVFVAGLDEETCREWTRVSPDVARFTVDREAREVTARALGMGKRVARFLGDGQGCVLTE